MLGQTIKERLETEGFATVKLEVLEDKEVLTESLDDDGQNKLSVEIESDGDHEKATIKIEDADGEQFYTVLRMPVDEEASADAIAQIIVDQVNYWS